MATRGTAGNAARPSRWKRRLVLLTGGIAVIGTCLAARYWWGDEAASAQDAGRPALGRSARGAAPAAQPAKAAPDKRELKIMAIVNGEEVSREDLAHECLTRYGVDVLDSLLNKQLIIDYCQRRDIRITRQDVDAEIDRVARRFRLTRDKLLAMLEEERGITARQYTDDIIWPTLALRKAAQTSLNVTPAEIQAAYETQYGPAVEGRMIVCLSEQKARDVQAKAKAAPDDFAALARQYSDDPTASSGGRILPIRMHLGDRRIEEAAFRLEPGQVSDVIQVGNQYVVIKCEGRVPSRTGSYPLDTVREQLTEMVREKKEPRVAGELFQELRERTKIVKVFGDDEATKRYPGVAAIVGEQTITLRGLADECIARHGVEVLEAVISRRVVEQHCRKHNVNVVQADIRTEVARAAEAMGVVDPATQKANIDEWLKIVEEEQGLPVGRYLDEIVWPTVALKKYVQEVAHEQINVDEKEIEKGFIASFGPRADCKAIIVNSQRTAEEIWAKAREQKNELFFGQLAKKYSMDPSAAIEGDVPPIQRYGGRPVLEEEAFKLKPGDISGIIQIDETFVILYCKGYTKPKAPPMEEVREEIFKDLYEKKLRIEMAKTYNHMMETSRIENFLADTRQVPRTARGSTSSLSQPPQLQPAGNQPGSSRR